MRLFWEITRLAFRRQMTYRAAAWAGLATNIFFGLLRATVMIALFGARDQVAGMTLQDAVTYTGLTQAVIAYLSIFGWYEVMDSVHSGDVASDLLRPLGYVRFWLAVDLGRAALNVLLRGVPIMLVYALFVELALPGSAAQWAALPRGGPLRLWTGMGTLRLLYAAASLSQMVPDHLPGDALSCHG
jgi:ABC-2 type transport system permease protein